MNAFFTLLHTRTPTGCWRIALAGATLVLGVATMTVANDTHRQHLKNPDGSWKYTNALAKESSPYLLQHAHNPVRWYPWGPEAFELARTTDRPIFLSVGYSTCYWCHVMERQCFEDPDIAALMNEHFVNIKVDREERPDVDDIYMAAVQIITRRGGWPMSVFLTPASENDPGLKPFWAGTYIPPRPAHGLPSFPQVLTSISNAWKTQRQEVLAQADRVTQALTEHLGSRDLSSPVSAELVQSATNQLLRSYDPEHGGFGSAPKFPQASNLLLLLAVHRNNPDADLWNAIDHTLDRMARGGMYDQVGGGFHRYSTDERWLVPHFEKMLYDQGQLIEVYCRAIAARDGAFYRHVVRQTCDYVLREMVDPSGAFWSAQDAEVDAREGGNYVWTQAQVRQALKDTGLADGAVKMYGLDLGPNFRDPHHEDAPPVNVLFLPEPVADLEGKRRIDAALLAVRDEREQPATDDKTLVAWNGLMIGALALAGRTLEEPGYTAAADRAAATILARMRSPDGGLYRTMRQDRAKIDAFLEDYAFFIHGLLELHRATGEKKWLDAAGELTRIARERFAHEKGGYYDTLENRPDLLVRTRSTYDGALPSGNSQMVHNLLDLFELTGEVGYLEQALSDLRAFGGALRQQGANMAHMQHALLRALEAAPAAAGGVESQPDGVVTVSVDQQEIFVSHDQPATLEVTLTIKPGFHLNTSKPVQHLLQPTLLALEGGGGVRLDVTYPPAQKVRLGLADEELEVYTGTVKLAARVTLSAENFRLGDARVVLSYQACDDTTCLAPRRVTLPVSLSLRK